MTSDTQSYIPVLDIRGQFTSALSLPTHMWCSWTPNSVSQKLNSSYFSSQSSLPSDSHISVIGSITFPEAQPRKYTPSLACPKHLDTQASSPVEVLRFQLPLPFSPPSLLLQFHPISLYPSTMQNFLLANPCNKWICHIDESAALLC